MKRLILALLILFGLSMTAEATPLRFFVRDVARESVRSRYDRFDELRRLDRLRDIERLERLERDRAHRLQELRRLERLQDHRPSVQFFRGRDGRLYRIVR